MYVSPSRSRATRHLSIVAASALFLLGACSGSDATSDSSDDDASEVVSDSTAPEATSATSAAEAGDEPKIGGELTVATGAELLTLDPTKGSANTMALIGSSIYDTLMIVPRIGDEPQPNIAQSFVESDDQMSWTMTLPEGLLFSDGTPFDAEAVKFNMDRAMQPGSTSAALLGSIESVDAPDATTVVFNMAEPFANLPYVFAYDGSGTAGYIASPTALEEYGDDYTANAAGVGPYMLESWSPGNPIELVRNPNYWNAEKPVYLDRVTVRVIDDPQSAYQAVQAGDVDIAATVTPAIMRSAADNDQVDFVQGLGGDQDSIILNMASDVFSDQRIRTAVSKAINREELALLTTEGFGGPAVSLFPPGSAYESGHENPTYDLEGAKALIAEYEAETGETPAFTFTCPNTRAQGEPIVNQLQAAGFDVTFASVERAAWLSAFFDSDYQAICWTMAGFLTPDNLPYRFLHSTGDLNTGGFNSPEFDALADAARVASDFDEQRALWADADGVLVEQLPWVWTASAPVGFITSKRVNSIDYDDPARLRYSVPTFANVWVSD